MIKLTAAFNPENNTISYTGTAKDAAAAYYLAVRLTGLGVTFYCFDNLFFRINFTTKAAMKKHGAFVDRKGIWYTVADYTNCTRRTVGERA